MQVATVAYKKPWICNVFFVVDEEDNFYWLSYPDRRHSLEIKKNQHTAIAIVIKKSLPVIGLQAEGTSEIVEDEPTVKFILEKYIEKYGEGKSFYDNFLQKKNKHFLYKFTPEKLIYLDEKNLGPEGRVTWSSKRNK